MHIIIVFVLVYSTIFNTLVASSPTKPGIKKNPYAQKLKKVVRKSASAQVLEHINIPALEVAIFPTNFCYHPPWNNLWQKVIIPYIGLETIAPTLYMRNLEKSAREPEHYDLRCFPYNETPALTINNESRAIQVKDRVIRLRTQTEPIQKAAINRQQTHIAIITQNKNVAIFNAINGVKLRELLHRNRVEFIGFNYDGTIIITTSWDYIIRLWNVQTGRMFKTFIGNRVLVKHAELNRDNTLLLSTAKRDSNAVLWHAQKEGVTKPMPNRHRTTPARFLSDGTIRTFNTRSLPTAWRCRHDGISFTKAQVALFYLLERPRPLKTADSIEMLAVRNQQNEATVRAILKSFDEKPQINSKMLTQAYNIAQTAPQTAAAKK